VLEGVEMREVTLLYKGKSPIQANFVHNDFCTKVGKCSCKLTSIGYEDHNPETGEIKYYIKKKLLPNSLHLIPGVRTIPMLSAFADAVLALPEIKPLAAKKLIKVEAVKEIKSKIKPKMEISKPSKKK